MRSSKPTTRVEIEPIDLFGRIPAEIDLFHSPSPSLPAFMNAVADAVTDGSDPLAALFTFVSEDSEPRTRAAAAGGLALQLVDEVMLPETEAQIAAEQAAAVAEPEPEVIPEIVPESVRQPRRVSPFVTYWKESEYVASCIEPDTNTVVLYRRGGGRVSVVPASLETAAELVCRSELDNWWEQQPNALRPLTKKGAKLNANGSIQFNESLLLHPDSIEQSPLVELLSSFGFTVVLPPSVRGWMPRELRRRERDQTPFLLPQVEDTRDLYDRVEPGMMLTCMHGRDKFSSGYNYIVIGTDQLALNEDDEEDVSEDEVEGATEEESGVISLVREGTNEVLKWSALDGPMESYFTVAAEANLTYSIENTFPHKYPHLYAEALTKIWKRFPRYVDPVDGKEKTPLFEHVYSDLAQCVHYRHLGFTHPPRMGKTSYLYGMVELAGSKNALMVTVANGVRIFKKEMKRLGIDDYQVVHKLKDLDAPKKYMVVSQSWLKTPGRKPPKKQHERLGAEQFCAECGTRLYRPLYQVVMSHGEKRYLRRGEPMLVPESVYIDEVGFRRAKSNDYGYICPNAECQSKGKRRITRSGYGAELFGAGGLVKNLDLAQHNLCLASGRDKFVKGGRECSGCGYVHRTWMPPRYKRVGKRFSVICTDEIHHIKSGTTMQAEAIRGITKARRRIGASGTLMPTKPRDCFYPFSWIFGNKNHLFPFSHGSKGVAEFNAEYTTTITMVSKDNNRYRRAIPYIKKPAKFAAWRSSRTFFRHYGDPEAMESLRKAGLIIPEMKTYPVELMPDPKQGLLLVASVADFDEKFQEYQEELRRQAAESEEGRSHLLNSAKVLARMQLMKYASTLPGLLNDKLIADGSPPVYDGEYGGVKMQFIREKVAEKVDKGEKVVIFSDHKAMQQLCARELALYNPMLFNTGWSQTRRDQFFEEFEEDDSKHIAICGQRSVNESVDLSAGGKCRTVISPDLLWSAGIQTQAWSRVRTPKPVERECELYVLLTKYSIDSHIYRTFYSRVAASDQALYSKTLTKLERGFDIKYFVETILAEKEVIMQWLIESGGGSEEEFLPIFHRMSQLQSRGDD